MKAHLEQLTCKNNSIQEGKYDVLPSQYFRVKVIRNLGLKSWKKCILISSGKKKKKHKQTQQLAFSQL